MNKNVSKTEYMEARGRRWMEL